jgi:hypothetical protein
MPFVLGSPHPFANGISFTQVGTLFGIAVIVGEGEMINPGAEVYPHDSVSRLSFSCVLSRRYWPSN